MLTKRAIRIVKLRLQYMDVLGGTWITYNKETDRADFPNNLILFNMMFGCFLGSGFFIFVHLLQLYFKLSKHEDIPEEGSSKFDSNFGKRDMHEFATIVIGWGEVAVVMSIYGLNIQSVRMRHRMRYLFNEIFCYAEKIHQIIADKNIVMDAEHLRRNRKTEVMIFLTCGFSFILGLLIMLTCLHPLEPTHVIIKEWLEIDWVWDPVLLPFLVLFLVAVMGTANVVVTVGLLAELGTGMATSFLDDLTVENVATKQGTTCILETRLFGNMEDQEICTLYRTQRLINELLNEIMGSIFISIHQVGMIASFAILLFFFVKFQHVLWGSGFIGFVTIFASVCTPLAICFYQSSFFGDLVDASEGFKDNGLKVVPRKTFFRRFILSCNTFYVEEAYPFFHYHKNTFLEFCAAGVDHAITLMLW